MSSEVKDLVRRAQKGDSDAFGELYGIYYKEMYSYACCVTGDAYAAEDAISDAVCSAFKQIKSLRNPDSFKGWLFRILNISCRNQYNIRNAHIALDDTLDTGKNDDGGIGNMELSIELKAAIKILSEEEREIVFLKVLNEYKSREIADILDLPPATVRSKLSRALTKLREALENQEKGGNE